MHKYFFKNNLIEVKNDVIIYDKEDILVKNFGKQWNTYRNVQIDSINNFKISKDFLQNLIFDKVSNLRNKTILEIGCGAGRFTEYLSQYSKFVVSVDLSDAIFCNISKNKKNVFLYKANFLTLIPNVKFDVVICRGVLQHTFDPLKSILKLYDFVNIDGEVCFDIYKMPKLGYFHPKYFLWRPFFQTFISYNSLEKFLKKRIKLLLKIKKKIDKIFMNYKFFSDSIIPVWDYHNILKLNDKQMENFAILDTLDGIYAKYDKPKSYETIIKFLTKNNINILQCDKSKNFFKTSLK